MTTSSFLIKLLIPILLLQSGLISNAQAQDFSPDPDWKITAYL